MFSWLWPIRTGITVIDVWSIFHLCFWAYMGSNLWSFGWPIQRAIVVGVLLSFAWEFFERAAEAAWPHIWKNPEGFLNAYVSDPLTSVVGILFAYYALNHWRYQ